MRGVPEASTMISRRHFLKAASVGFGALVVPQVLWRARTARAAGTDPVLISIFLRGGADGLNLVPPHQDPLYYAARPTIAIPQASVVDLDGFFGLHPSLAPLQPLYQSGRLAVIHASGSPHITRSHFEAQDFIDFAAPGDKTVRVGWLNRFLTAAGLEDPGHAITIGPRSAKSLAGPAPKSSIASLSQFQLDGSVTLRRPALEAMYENTTNPLLTSLATNMFARADVVASLPTATSVIYPNSPFGKALKDMAALVKGDVGMRLGAIDLGGWDHHFDENADLPDMAANLASSLASFAQDLGSDLDRTVVLVMSEFGRRLHQNGAEGTDHGRAGVMFAMGGGIAGGRVLLANDTWPGLAPEQLIDGIDLSVTTDFRDVFAELLTRHMGLADASPIFPGYAPDPSQYPGLFV
jgi:uncharacterized protein (DUF1501 family)